MSLFKRLTYLSGVLLVVCGVISAQQRTGYGGHDGLGMGTVGISDADAIGINASEYLTTWNFNNLPSEERARYYQESVLPGGQVIREYWFYSVDRDIEIAPGIIFPAWTYSNSSAGSGLIHLL